MAIAIHLQEYLNSQGIAFEVITHPRAMTAIEAAHKAAVPSAQVAKAVLLEDDDGYVLAAIPASHRMQLGLVRDLLNRRLGLATEPELSGLFDDCELGAIPAAGDAYGLPMVFDDSLAAQPDIYLEGGDHCSLVHIRGEDFRRMMASAQHARFSDPG